MRDIWAFLLQTLTASGAAALLLVVKAMFRDKLSPRWQFAIWGLAICLFLSAIRLLKEERRDLALLRPLGILLLIWHGADWVFSWFGGTLDGHFDIISLIISLAGLYFHFQLFTDFAALAAKFSSQRTALTAACFGGEPSRRCC